MFTVGIARPAAQVSLVVGTLLNAVNQGPELLHNGQVSWLRVAMNYVVPWCVSAFSAARQARAASPQSPSVG
ncbi:MAG: hypothetical protein RL684_2672 [Pseudomonadota bacterium]|jgi:hypothetical protein